MCTCFPTPTGRDTSLDARATRCRALSFASGRGRFAKPASGSPTAFRLSQVGSVHRGLTLEDGSLVVTGNYLKVRIPPGHCRNEWVDVRILRLTDSGMTAKYGQLLGG